MKSKIFWEEKISVRNDCSHMKLIETETPIAKIHRNFTSRLCCLSLWTITILLFLSYMIISHIIVPYCSMKSADDNINSNLENTIVIWNDLIETKSPRADLSNSNCPADLEDELKFDCFPQGNADEERCVERGCCWSPNYKEFVPWCWYPSNYALYSFLNVSRLNGSRYNGVVGYMEQVSKSGYPEDVPLLKLVATFESRHRLRVKIFDAEKTRYEVNVLDTLTDGKLPVNETDFEFSVNTGVPGFSVLRKSTRTVIFSTVGVGGFIFANQLLQVSTFLPSGNIYGLGEHQDSLRHSTDWNRFALFAHDEVPNKDKNLYGAHPFYLMMENDGLSHGVFLKNSDPIDVVLQPAPAITFRILGGILDFYFFLGPSPQEVIEQYTEVIGRPAMPPYWGLGFHLCRYNYGSLNRTREIWKRTRDAGIPFDVQWNDLDYMDSAKDFTYDKEKFSGLPEFVKELHSVGMHYVPIIDPGISNAEERSKYPPYDLGIEMDIFVKNSADLDSAPFVGKVWTAVTNVWPDFTHPNATEYWTKQLQSYHSQVPFDGAWIDMNEPSNFFSGTADGCPADSPWDNPPYLPAVVGDKLYYRTLCMSANQYAGLHYNVHNLYGLTESMATNFALREIRGKRPFIISRSTFPGQGRFGGHWSGDVISDWTNLRRSISSILNYNMYGIPLVGADICGFNGNSTATLCQRWMELGAFYPFSRNHNTDDAIDQDPVAFGPAVVASSKKALLIRYMLLPYLYTLFWHAHVVGTTVARPLFFEFPFDRETYTIDTQFLWGGGLMIAPVLAENTFEIEVYLPSSLWYDFYSLQLVSSGPGKWIKLPAPLDTIPLLLRGGHIIPTQEPELTTSLTRLKPFDLFVMLNETGRAQGGLYLDDGDAIDAYEQSLFNLVQFTASTDTVFSKVAHWNYEAPSPCLVRDIIVLGMSDRISSVVVNGVDYSDFSNNSAKKVLYIRNMNLLLKNSFTVKFH